MLPTFAKTRRVIAVELQGHGHTADIDRSLTYEQMADDVAALFRQLTNWLISIVTAFLNAPMPKAK